VRLGSLCTGYGGLDMAVEAVTGATTAWVSDIDKGACKILAHRHPDLPNLGDFAGLDWSGVEPIDILCAGFPCQPVSHAGKRHGDLDERWLWDDVARAVGALRPGLVVLENVRGLLTAGSGRLFGLVLGALADLGYDAQWHGLRAADTGAPHNRFRIFIVATDRHGQGRGGIRGPVGGLDTDGRGRADGPRPQGQPATLLPTPRTSDTNGAGAHGDGGLDLRTVVGLLPTPMSRDYRTGYADGKAAPGRVGSKPLTDIHHWGDYAAAIARWEHTLGRPAPDPTQSSSKGNPQLAPAFVEWMMGLPAGWVTDVPDITRNEALKALGNGVVPQQAAEALRIMATWQVAA
jgi:DNA (cytosine-5)-methyltransferase 1